MPKKSFQKQRIIAVRDLLLERTDESNYIPMNEIITALKAQGLEADRRTIVEDIETLTDMGMDILRDTERKALSYAVVSREFELQELKLLLDCVQVSKFLPQNKTDELSEKLCKLCSKHEALQLNGQVHRNHIKSDNDGIYRFIDTIHQAIKESKPIQFQLESYLPSKNKEFRHDGKEYIVYPFALVYAEENYYLIAHEYEKGYPDLKDIKHYRVDRIKNIKIIISEKTDYTYYFYCRHAKKFSKEINIEDYTKQNFAMYGGKIELVTIQFPNHMAGVVFDRFGIDIHMPKVIDEGHFTITEPIAVSPQFYGWIFGLGKEVKIVSPAHVAQGMKDLLKDTYNIYTVKRNRQKVVESS